MSARSARRAKKALSSRQTDYDSMSLTAKKGKKRPGSTNEHKSRSTNGGRRKKR